MIDDDLGRSGAGARRSGFERLLAAICEGRVGAVFSLEASRLARNGHDWHTLLEFCGLVGTLIIDEDGVYDAASAPGPTRILTPSISSSIIEAPVDARRLRRRRTGLDAGDGVPASGKNHVLGNGARF